MHIDKLKFTQLLFDLVKYCCNRTPVGGKIHIACGIEKAPDIICSNINNAEYLLVRVLDYGTRIDHELLTSDVRYANMMMYLHIMQYIMKLHKGTVGKYFKYILLYISRDKHCYLYLYRN